jgi:hypothetical protein
MFKMAYEVIQSLILNRILPVMGFEENNRGDRYKGNISSVQISL